MRISSTSSSSMIPSYTPSAAMKVTHQETTPKHSYAVDSVDISKQAMKLASGASTLSNAAMTNGAEQVGKKMYYSLHPELLASEHITPGIFK